MLSPRPFGLRRARDLIRRLGVSDETYPDEPGRWEFRCWRSADERSVFAPTGDWSALPEEARADIYLRTPEESGLLVKIRDGARIEAKVLVDVRNRLERWRPLFELGFPVERGAGSTLFGLLAPGATPPEAACDGLVFFVAAVNARGCRPATALIEKRRRRWRSGARWIESVHVTLDGWRASSLCVESKREDDVSVLLRDLDLEGQENLNYGAAIERRLCRPKEARRKL